MMNSAAIVWEKELASGQMFRTWLATVDGEKCIVKRMAIPEKHVGKIFAVKEKLQQQLVISQKIAPEDKESIVLFDRCEEYDGQGIRELLYIRPFIPGTQLSNRIREAGFLGEKEAVRIFLAIGRVIAKAHDTYGLYHGDLKPENILLRDDSSVSVIDWDTLSTNRAIQEDMSDGRTLAFAEIVAGTPQYMAPEQCETMKSSEKGDVYALGMIFYKMLTGETPYDGLIPAEIPAKKREQIVPLNVAYAGSKIDISADISQIIDEALCVDPNSRTQSVDALINAVENFVAAPIVTTSTRTIAAEDYTPAPEKKSPDAYNLVLVGHSGSGKTVLAAGLYATTTDKFSVEAKDQKTRKFADNTKTLLATHKWPDHTGKKGVNLAFTLYFNGAAANICFKEYAGEALNTINYYRDYFDAPDGVLMLLNPNIMEQDELKRTQMVSTLKDCVTYLCDLPNPPPIALVITAADRLKTDFKDKAAGFQKLAVEIERSMRSKKAVFRKYEVSVTGKLENQQNADLDPVNVQKPFMWILSQIEKKGWIRSAKKYFMISLTVFCILAFCALGRYVYEYRQISKLSDEISVEMHNFKESEEKDQTEGDKEDHRLEHLKKLTAMRAERCAEGHIRTDKNIGTRKEKCSSACSPRFLFFRDRFNGIIADLDQKIDQAKYSYLDIRLTRAVAAVTPDNVQQRNKDVVKTLQQIKEDCESWTPLVQDSELRKNLTRACEEKIPPAKERYEFYKIKAELDSILTNAQGQESPGDLHLPTSAETSKLTKDEYQRLCTMLNTAHDDARRKVASRIFNSLKELLNSAVENPDQEFPQARYDSLYEKWTKAKQYLKEEAKQKDMEITSSYANVLKTLFVHKNESLRNELEQMDSNSPVSEWKALAVRVRTFLETEHDERIDVRQLEFDKTKECLKNRIVQYIDSRWKSFDDAQRKTADKIEPDFQSDVSELLSVLPEYQKEFSGLMNEKIASTQNEWDNKRAEAVAEFLRKNSKKKVTDIIEKACNFSHEESYNPYLSRIDGVILDKSLEFFSAFLDRVKQRNFSSADFEEAKVLCARLSDNAIKNLPGIKTHPLSQWAARYLEWEKDSRKTKIQFGELCGRVNYENPDNPYFESFSCWKETQMEDKIHRRISLVDKKILKEYTYHLLLHFSTSTEFNKESRNLLFNNRKLWPPEQEKFDVGDILTFETEIYDRRGRDWKVCTISRTFYPGIEEIKNPETFADPENKAEVFLTLEVSGTPFETWLRENPLPKR